MALLITRDEFNIHNLLAYNNSTPRALEVGSLSVKDTTSIIQLSSISQRAVIRAGNVSTAETEIEGSIKFAVGNNAFFTLDSGDNNVFQLKTDANYTFECYGNYNGVNEYRERMFIGESGIKMNHLSGSGTRMMVTDENGNISSQSIPQAGANFSNTNLVATGSRIHDFGKLYTLDITDATSMSLKSHSTFGNARLFLGSNSAALEAFTNTDRLTPVTTLSVSTTAVDVKADGTAYVKVTNTTNGGMFNNVPTIISNNYNETIISHNIQSLSGTGGTGGGYNVGVRANTSFPGGTGIVFNAAVITGYWLSGASPMLLFNFSTVNNSFYLPVSAPNIHVGTTSVSGKLVIAPSNGATGTAPIRLETGGATLLTTPAPGAFETDGTDLYFTNSAGVRKKVTLT